MAYLRGFSHGLVCGAVVGALVAPRPGIETRRRLDATARRWTGRGQRLAATTESGFRRAESGWRRAEPMLRAAAQGVSDVAQTAEPVARRAAQRLMELARGGQPLDAVVLRSRSAGTGTNGAAGTGPPAGNGGAP